MKAIRKIFSLLLAGVFVLFGSSVFMQSDGPSALGPAAAAPVEVGESPVGAAEEIDVAAPAATLSVTGEGFTGAVARVRVFALGEGADSATARVEVSATQDFAVTVWSGEAEVAAAGTVDIAATGLAFGTDYWARGIMTNAIGGAVALGPVTFSTPSPGAPEGVAEFVERGFTTLSALGVATSYGEAQSLQAVSN